jgi:predicted ferric reductase
MNPGASPSSSLLQPRTRKLCSTLLFILTPLVLLGFPVMEMIEYTGQARLFSRDWYTGLGAPFGLAGALLLCLQLVIAAKLRFLDRIIPLNKQFAVHRSIGAIVVCCLLLHPLIMFWPQLPRIGPFNLANWPEMLGGLTLIGLTGGVLTALLRPKLRIPYHLWRPLHRAGMLSLALLAGIHFSFVEEHFELGGLQVLLLAALLTFGLARLKWQGNAYTVTGLRRVGRDTHAVSLEPQTDAALDYAPGQFALVTFLSDTLPREEHPWTISSSPTQGKQLQLTIKHSGDFTRRITELAPGDTARIRGPYGQFSHLALGSADRSELIMIAGGVGLTPFLSMLRFLADTGSQRSIRLIWSNKTEQDILWPEELDRLQSQLPGLAVHHVLTRQPDWDGYTGHLGTELLSRILSDAPPDSQIFLCGPPPMMAAVRHGLNACGFPQKHIHTEAFSF